jgi:hypothetical protein
MSANPALFIGAVKTAVKQRIMDQSIFRGSHISWKNAGTKCKGHAGQEAIVAQLDEIKTRSFNQ